MRLFGSVRRTSIELARPLTDADATAQSMPDASPAKWHLAHTTWFFEAMLLQRHVPGYRVFDAHYGYLFNSYYDAVGQRHPRPQRGLLTRPRLQEVYAYRHHVDAALALMMESELPADVLDLIELGCHHEQQHQELFLTDILHLFAQNPLRPAYRAVHPAAWPRAESVDTAFQSFEGGLVDVGHGGGGFAFDSEGPRHRRVIEPFSLATKPVTNRQWLAFMEDGGYRNPLLWLADGWAKAQAEDWSHPLYWEARVGAYWSMTLGGLAPLELDAPVVHVSLFEADAFARWAGARLPTEFEWEVAARDVRIRGNLGAARHWRPQRASDKEPGLQQLYGDVWEWTSSAFAAYPRFTPAEGAVGEYNGKFMSGQFVLRGGSCVTPGGHIRPSYRNFFPPDARWQFSGLRLAKDI
ncbi:MAG: ergothioneine biosynthesis protein EgtB [Rhodoferax sp.]|nr:ergothioneine biosynthesis protein EgtB [Rhodoferax sp.]